MHAEHRIFIQSEIENHEENKIYIHIVSAYDGMSGICSDSKRWDRNVRVD